MASKNGCHNRMPFANHIWMQDGTMEIALHPDLPITAVPVFQYVPHRMRKDCSYTETELGQADKGCVGCSWRKDGKSNEA